MVPGDETEVSQEITTVKTEHLSAPDARILVVDDNEFNLRVAHGLLNLLEIDAKITDSGKEAVKLISENDFDIVFMDHMMPEMDGVETLEEIRKLGEPYTDLPIIALTANAVQGAKEMFLANGFNGFIAKPINKQELIVLLIDWLPQDKIIFKPKTEDDSSKPDEAAQSEFLAAVGIISEINAEIGMNHASGVESMYRNNLERFYKKLAAECSQMNACLSDNDLKKFSIFVHSMKSMLSTIGAMDLSDEAFMLETASKNADMITCQTRYPGFEEKLLTMQKALEKLFPADTAVLSKEPGSHGFLADNLKKALTAADDCDSDAGLSVTKAMLVFDFGEHNNALLENVNAAFSVYDFDKATEQLRIINVNFS
jgi:CheY-like chemotaxis protein